MFALISIAIFATCDGWGGSIHREITSIALRHLSSNKVTKRYFREHLGDAESIMRASTWADTDEASSAYPGSDDLHFSNTPWRECSPFNMTRDCGFEGSGQCIVTGIADMVMIATDPTRSKEERTDALKFVLHLVADMHQPLHTGFMKDNGGCNILLDSEPKMSLHQMWDYGLVDHTVASEVDHGVSTVPLPSTIDGRESLIEYTSALATESSTLFTCAFAYRDETGEFIVSKSTLSPEYMASRRMVAIERIATAGQRLAQLINLMAISFARNKLRRVPVVSTPVPKPVSTNRYELLDIEFEPDEIVDRFTEFISVPKVEKKGAAKKSTDTDAWDTLSPDTSLIHIGSANLDDIVLIKSNEAYWLTCADILREDPKYAPMMGTIFRVRFMRNRRRTEPIMFFADAVCFGVSHTMTREEFLTILIRISGNRDNTTIASELTAPVASATRMNQKDVLDIAPLRWEAVRQLPHGVSVGRYVRGWTVLYKENPDPVLGYVEHLRNVHVDMIGEQIRRAESMNLTMDALWDLDFYSNFASIKAHQFRNMIILTHKNTLTDRDMFEVRYAISRSVAPDGEQLISLIDTTIFDGLVTPRIHKGIWAISKKSKGTIKSDFIHRPTFVFEIRDIWTVLMGEGRNRIDTFNAIKGYFMYPSMLSYGVAYIEWTIKPFVLMEHQEPLLTSP